MRFYGLVCFKYTLSDYMVGTINPLPLPPGILSDIWSVMGHKVSLDIDLFVSQSADYFLVSRLRCLASGFRD